MGMVREVLGAEAVLPSQSVGFGDAIEVIASIRPDVLVVGFTKSRDASIALAQTLVKEQPNLTLVALADRSDADAILAAMRVGFKEFVVLPGDAARLRQVVHEAAYSSADDDDKGIVISMLGSKGGVGVTTLASHLGAELAAIHRVIAIDLNFATGDIASILDVRSRETIADMAARGTIDDRVLTNAAAVHRSKLHVLTTPDSLAMMSDVRAEEVYAVIDAAARLYQYVILDCGTYTDEAVTMATQVADIVVLIVTPDVTSVRDGMRRIKLLASLGVDKARIRLVVNRNSKTAFVTNADIQKSLGQPIAAVVADDHRTVDQAINEGKLIRDVNRRADVSRDISNLVAVLTELGEGSPETPEASTGFLSRFFSR